MDIANLTEAEKVSLAKAEAGGVNVSAYDNDGELIENEVVPPEAAPKVKPAGLPDKFWNATTGTADYEGLAKSYTELEKSRGKPAATPGSDSAVAAAAAAKAAADSAAQTPEAKAAADAAAALATAKAAEAASLAAAAAATPEGIAAKAAADKVAADALAAAAAVTPQKAIESANAEFAKDGKLSDATYETLAKTGINKSMVDMYIAGQVATRDAQVAEVMAAAGGQEEFTKVAAWAKASLTPAELAEYNQNAQASVPIAKLAVAALRARYVAENGTDGTLVTGGNPTGGNAQGYANQSEMMAAIRDPRYKNDATYRASVEAKIGKSADF